MGERNSTHQRVGRALACCANPLHMIRIEDFPQPPQDRMVRVRSRCRFLRLPTHHAALPRNFWRGGDRYSGRSQLRYARFEKGHSNPKVARRSYMEQNSPRIDNSEERGLSIVIILPPICQVYAGFTKRVSKNRSPVSIATR